MEEAAKKEKEKKRKVCVPPGRWRGWQKKYKKSQFPLYSGSILIWIFCFAVFFFSSSAACNTVLCVFFVCLFLFFVFECMLKYFFFCQCLRSRSVCTVRLQFFIAFFFLLQIFILFCHPTSLPPNLVRLVLLIFAFTLFFFVPKRFPQKFTILASVTLVRKT